VWHDLTIENALEQHKTPQQISAHQQTVNHQRFTSARLSVPHERRKREPFQPQKRLQSSPIKRRGSNSDGTSAMEKMTALRFDRLQRHLKEQSAKGVETPKTALSTGFPARRGSQPRQPAKAQLRIALQKH